MGMGMGVRNGEWGMGNGDLIPTFLFMSFSHFIGLR